MFYKVYHLDGRIKDADQRIAEDIRQFGDSFTDLAIWGVRLATADSALNLLPISRFSHSASPLNINQTEWRMQQADTQCVGNGY